jgi:hypothetical protein
MHNPIDNILIIADLEGSSGCWSYNADNRKSTAPGAGGVQFKRAPRHHSGPETLKKVAATLTMNYHKFLWKERRLFLGDVAFRERVDGV